MRWFQGSIPAAINAAKQRNCIFVVVVTGEDEQSTQLLATWQEEKVSKAATNCVAIQVDAKSETCLLFSHIYPVVCVPSSFFIGANGTPLEVIAGSVSAEELVQRIHTVSLMHLHYVEGGKVSTQSDSPVEAVSSDHTAAAPAAQQAAPGDHRGDDPASSAETTSADQEPPSTEDTTEQVKRLTRRLEERQEQKRMEEEEKEIKNEIKRRKVGRDLQDFQRKQDEEKTKRLLEERNREKLMERAARERVKQQIALDRAERAARYANTKQEVKASSSASQGAEAELKKKTSSPSTSSTARIQFRLPDGSSLSSSFSSQAHLQEARHFVVQEVGSRYGNFSLATMFPRREFTSEDLDRTLLELELVPSASVVLLPQSESSGYTVSSPAGGVWAMLSSLFFPLLAVWRFFTSFLFAAPSQPLQAPVRGTAPEARGGASHPNTARREAGSQQRADRKPQDYKRDGRICRLRTQDDGGEEDNNTWNGNSTQQM